MLCYYYGLQTTEDKERALFCIVRFQWAHEDTAKARAAEKTNLLYLLRVLQIHTAFHRLVTGS
jgi:hypothetical protein